MIRFKVKGLDGHYLCPSVASDIRFLDFLRFLNIKKPQSLLALEELYAQHEKNLATTADTSLQQEIDEKTNYYNLEYLEVINKYFVEVIVSFVAIDRETVLLLELHNIEFLYFTILKALVINNIELKYDFEYDGIQYGLPESLMQNATLIEYIESAQLQAAQKNIENGNFAAMYDILCVLLRRKVKDGQLERYTEAVYWRNKEDFSNIDLQTVSEVSFFLQSQMSRFAESFQIYTLSQALSKSRQVFKI